MPSKAFHPVTVRAQVVTLAAIGMPVPQIATYLSLPPRTVRNIINRATERGYNPASNPRVELEHVEDSPRSGRPKKKAEGTEQAGSASSTQGGNRQESSENLASEATVRADLASMTLERSEQETSETVTTQATEKEVPASGTQDRSGQEKASDTLASEAGISHSSDLPPTA